MRRTEINLKIEIENRPSFLLGKITGEITPDQKKSDFCRKVYP